MGDYDIVINANYLETPEFDLYKVSVFPNPANNEFYLSGYEGKMKLYDLTGKMVRTFENKIGEPNKLDTLIDGVYFVHIERNGSVFQEKLIVKK